MAAKLLDEVQQSQVRHGEEEVCSVRKLNLTSNRLLAGVCGEKLVKEREYVHARGAVFAREMLRKNARLQWPYAPN